MMLHQAYDDSHAAGLCSDTMYLDWIRKLHDEKKNFILDSALKAYPSCGPLWCLYVAHTGSSHENFQRAIKSSDDKTISVVWMQYLEWIAKEADSMGSAVFDEALNNANLSEQAEQILDMYVNWAQLVGIETLRNVVDAQHKKRPLTTSFLKRILSIEASIESPDPQRISRLWELAHNADMNNVDTWIAHIKFEMDNGAPTVAARVYWRAQKNVGDVEDLNRRYQAIKC